MTANLPAVIPGHDGNPLLSQFAGMVDNFHAKILPHEQAIAQGANPFRAWREHSCEIKEEVAEALDLDIHEYLEIEDDVHAANCLDIIRFCRYFRLHPYDLMGSTEEPMTTGILDAMLAVYDKPGLLPHKALGARDMARQLLLEEASTAYLSLQKTGIAMRREYPRHQGLTIEFIDALLARDGQLSVNRNDLSIKEQGDCFWENADDERNAARLWRDHYTAEWNRHGRKYHEFGRYLFRDGWTDINQSLRTTFRFAGLDNMMELYLSDPQFIGRRDWPDLAAPLFIARKAYSWREGQIEHGMHAELMFLAFEEKQRLGKRFETLEFQCNLFDEWMDRHENMLWRFENRQMILRHPDFAYLADTSRKKQITYQPDI